MSDRRSLQVNLDFDPSPVLSTTVLVNGQPTARALFSGSEFAQAWLASLLAIADATHSHTSPASTPALASQRKIFKPGHALSTKATRMASQRSPTSAAAADDSGMVVVRPPKRKRSRHSQNDTTDYDGVFCDMAETPPQRLDLSTGRMVKLNLLLIELENYKAGNVHDYDELITRLYCPEGDQPAAGSMKQVGHILGRMGSRYIIAGTIYTLLSWNIFREEEQSLIRTKHVSPPVAAKEINALMANSYNKHTASLDWASDGRRAASVVFRAFDECNCSMVVRSFALIALASRAKFCLIDMVERANDEQGTTTIDRLLKMAHFPPLRDHFYVSWVQLLRCRTREWEDLASQGYPVFDYEGFLAGILSRPSQNDVQTQSSAQSASRAPSLCSTFDVTSSQGTPDVEVEEGRVGVPATGGPHPGQPNQFRGFDFADVSPDWSQDFMAVIDPRSSASDRLTQTLVMGISRATS